MSHKLTNSEFVKKVEATHGSFYDLSSSVYTGGAKKVTVLCREHGPFSIIPSSLYSGSGCPECAKGRQADKMRMPIDQVVQRLPYYLNRISYPNLHTEYKNTTSKITVNCTVHGVSVASAQSLVYSSKYGCASCGVEARTLARTTTTEDFIKQARAVHGDTYDYSKVNYTKSTELVTIICKKHGEFSQTAVTHTQGSGCTKCANASKNDYRKTTLSDVKAKLANGVTVVEEEYRAGDKKINLWCSEHGGFTINKTRITQNTMCPKCNLRKVQDSLSVSFDEFEKRAIAQHSDRYRYDPSSYTQITNKVSIHCPEHGWFSQKALDHTNQAHGCPVCRTNKDSKPQVVISQTLDRFGIDNVRNYKIGDTRFEVDVFIPSLNIGIEYNGLYYHSQRLRNSSSVHLDKMKLAEKAGIRLIQLFSDEVEQRESAVTSFIMNIIGVNRAFKIYARTCTIEEVSQQNANDFYDTCHIQGAYRSGINYGLYYKNVLVACMTFSARGSGRRALNATEYELARYASSESVVGGASRLFKKLRVLTSANKVITFSDNRLFTGGMYEILGFVKTNVYGPNYSYVDTSGKSRIHKSRFQHSRLKDLFGSNYDATKTERENCEANGYYRIYDCGLTKWVWTKETASEDTVS